MIEHDLLGIRYFSYDIFEPYQNLTSVVTTRRRGRSKAPYDSLNLGLHVGDDPDAVLENRAIAGQIFGFEPETFTVARQVHGANVLAVGSADEGRGAIVEDDALPDADAMISRAPGFPLAVLVADCVALSFFDPVKIAVGVAHAGWKGTLGRIAEATVGAMTTEYGTSPSDLRVGVSPSIGKCHYEIDGDVAGLFRDEFGESASVFLSEDSDKLHLDLWEANRLQLVGAGVPADRIEIAAKCTACESNMFYSHRGDKGSTGRFAAIVMLHYSGSRTY